MPFSIESFIEPEMALRLGLSVLFGGLLGFEREAHGRAAGLRTLILVCMGSTLITMASAMLPTLAPSLARDIVRVDPGRISAGIVTGVGFLGGAVVIKLGDLVRGVTTAASIWFVAALGIVLGQGHYLLACYATVLGLLVLGLFPYFGRIVRAPVYRRVELVAVIEHGPAVRGAVAEIFARADLRVLDLFAAVEPEQGLHLTYHIRAAQRFQAADVVGALAGIAHVQSVRWH